MAKTQCEVVLDYIKEHGSITQRDAFRLGIYRLASRVSDLKRAGYPVIGRTEEVVNVDGTKSHISRYSLAEIKNDERWEI